MTSSELLDAAGRRRSPATMPGFHCGRPPRNKGRTYPADPPTVEEIVAVMRRAGDRTPGLRTRALIVLLWRAGLRINEALSLAESDLDPARGSILVRRGKRGRRRQVGMGTWGWGASQSVAGGAAGDAGRRSALRRGWADGRAALVGNSGSGYPAPSSSVRRRPQSLCSAPAAPHARGRDVPRGNLADRDPATARALCRPRDHVQIFARDRQHRDHPRRLRPARTDDSREPTTRASALTSAQPVPDREAAVHRGLTPGRTCAPLPRRALRITLT